MENGGGRDNARNRMHRNAIKLILLLLLNQSSKILGFWNYCNPR